jgi:hypothetical protein
VRLGLERLEQADDLVAVRVGETRLEFVPSCKPVLPLRALAPGNRLDELLDWADERVELLPNMDRDEVVFDLTDWGAQEFYFDDPAGNIVEAIVHRGLGETSAEGSFEAEELLGFSELGLVGDTAAMAELLVFHLGLKLWDGTVEHEGRLAFVGDPPKPSSCALKAAAGFPRADPPSLIRSRWCARAARRAGADQGLPLPDPPRDGDDLAAP